MNVTQNASVILWKSRLKSSTTQNKTPKIDSFYKQAMCSISEGEDKSTSQIHVVFNI